ncbi:MAG: CarD family transcriptional regulator [Alteromonas naphthalenivorans]|jgi:CarD family transcriptional regulator
MRVSLEGESNMAFSLNDQVVYPGHGVASICKVFSRNVASQNITFFELQFQNKDMTIMVPSDKLEEVGVRPLSSVSKINDMLAVIAQPSERIKTFEPTATNWNRRKKEYQNKLQTGSLEDISEIYRDLKHISRFKELSFGEKNLLLKTEALLAEEISAANKVDSDKAVECLRSIFIKRLDSDNFVKKSL